MLRQDAARTEPDITGNSPQGQSTQTELTSLDIQEELNRLEDIVLESPRFFGRTLIDEDRLLEQLDLVRLNLPKAFELVKDIIRQKEEILSQAQDYARDIIELAEQRAAEILDEIGIIRQAKLEAERMRQEVHRECEEAQQETIAEIERLRRQAKQEIDEMRRMALEECEAIQNGADDYADRVLENIEHQLTDMLRTIHNGRNRLAQDTPQNR
ncbi:MAG TPA: hypothetical protein IGS52_17610 [Oscillatoriaceae cyanobacterium M33_DOE_052]|uniref:DivIVA domain-containing protein n=1 Tax=Planktothricoides sp. SpSt-374 TaxID=2282167 RepID=A0A7C3ZJZ2_9CYAN|nr:hypothetical protein [Oscillatoriaceae cyanobacterium M33_DOE_052]